MTAQPLNGATRVAGVVGRPITHSLSPLLHNAWLSAAGLNGVYVPLSPAEEGFARFVDGLRGGVMTGLNVTMPFKEAALKASDKASPPAGAAAAANLLLFHADGTVEARNTDGDGLLYAFARQAPTLDLKIRPVVIIGAGGAARGAVAALLQAGVSPIRLVNRTRARAQLIAEAFESVSAFNLEDHRLAFADAGVIINATSAEVSGGELSLDLTALPEDAAAMDMLYRPLETNFLRAARRRGLKTIDGLDMLIGQAIPSFEALFGQAPPESVNARALLLAALKDDG
jgi:shikimate dehydrogenase